jgi:hypothetical protein
METRTRDSNEAPAATTCAGCHATDKVTSVTITGRVVYLRCRRCRIFWSIPERRASFRTQDARKVFDVYR